MVDLKEIKSRIRIEDVIGRSVELRRQGSRLVGRCPFHDDGGRPNLVVFLDGQRFHCFVCGAHGDVIDFVSMSQGLALPEAVKALGGEAKPADRLPPMRVRRRTSWVGKKKTRGRAQM